MATQDAPSPFFPNRRQWLATGFGCLLAAPLALAAGASIAPEPALPALIEPEELARQLRAGARPAIFQVGFEVLFVAAHIPGAVYAGPAGKSDGLERLRRALSPLSRGGEVVLYCGCCPWARCPNIRPAGALAARLGFRRARLLHLEQSFARDWVRAGYPAAGRDFPAQK